MNHKFQRVLDAFDDKPLVQRGQTNFLINPLTEQIPATSAQLLQDSTDWLVEVGDFEAANKIVGEEDKGAILVASTSLKTGLPFGMARWYPSGLAGQVPVAFEMEYASGNLYLNGVSDGDQVIIVDDMISTGGTLLALIKAIHSVPAEIVDIICVAEKVDYSGVRRVMDETGLHVKTLLRVTVAGKRSRIVD